MQSWKLLNIMQNLLKKRLLYHIQYEKLRQAVQVNPRHREFLMPTLTLLYFDVTRVCIVEK